MKKVLLIVVVAALALTLVPLAIAGAAGGGGHGKAKFNFVGTVVEPVPDAAPGTLTIKVKAGTKTVRALVRGDAAAIAVAEDAKIRLLTEEGAVTIMLAEIPVGAKVKARGTIDRSVQGAPPVFIIKDLKVKAPPAEPTTPPPTEPTTPPAE